MLDAPVGRAIGALGPADREGNHVRNDSSSPALRDRTLDAAHWLGLAGVLSALIAPRGAAWSMLLVAAALLAAARPRLRPSDGLPLPAATVALLAFGAYLVVNASWAADRKEAYEKVAFFFIATAVAAVAIASVARAERSALERLTAAVPIGVGVGALFLLIEVLLDQPISRLIGTWLPFARPDPKHAQVVGDRVVAINDYRLNRNLGVLSLLLFPALLALKALLPQLWFRTAAALLAATTALAVLRSAHETSMLALAFAGTAFAGMWLWPLVMRRLITAGFVIATLLVVPIALASYSAGLWQARWIPETGRNRIILWSFTASEWRKAPLLGIGVASTRELDARAGPTAERLPGHTYALRTGRHSHNIFMQTWYELGAVGAALLLAIGLALLALLRRLPRSQAPYAYATFVSAVLIGCFSWGLWQAWFMAAFATSAIALAIALETAERREADVATLRPE